MSAPAQPSARIDNGPIDNGPVYLPRPRPMRALISLAPMIDVLLILLVFFMVTSTYLDLDMIPAVTPEVSDAAPATAPSTEAPTLMIRVGADGLPAIRGAALTDAALTDRLREAAASGARVLVLPSGAAPMQALVSVMDRATEAGVTSLRVVQLEARP